MSAGSRLLSKIIKRPTIKAALLNQVTGEIARDACNRFHKVWDTPIPTFVRPAVLPPPLFPQNESIPPHPSMMTASKATVYELGPLVPPNKPA